LPLSHNKRIKPWFNKTPSSPHKKTDAGHARVADVAAVVFAYLRLLRAPGGVSRAAWDELRALQQLRFDFRDKPSPYSYVTSLAMGMHHYADAHLLTGTWAVPMVRRSFACVCLRVCSSANGCVCAAHEA
jgi:hypothetical protein